MYICNSPVVEFARPACEGLLLMLKYASEVSSYKKTNMFNKLVSNLPFNPSLIDQVSFYGTRLKRDAYVRRVGLIMLSLTIALQLFAVFSPARPTLAHSANDLLEGGVNSADEAATKCRKNEQGYGDVLAAFAITCDNVATAKKTKLGSKDYNDQLYSVGRLTYGKSDEKTVQVKGSSYCMRHLSSWDTSSATTHDAVSGTGKDGQKFFLTLSNGNVGFVGTPKVVSTDSVPANAPSLTKSVSNDTKNLKDANGSTAAAGDSLTYTLAAKNNGEATITGFVVQENISDVLDYADIVTLGGGTKDKTNILSWAPSSIKPGETLSRSFTVRVKTPIPATPVSASDPHHFDLIMSNVYGTSVTIKLPAPTIKVIESTTKTLPSTGPGSSLLISFAMLSVVGYFFARSRLLARELAIIKVDHSSSGTF